MRPAGGGAGCSGLQAGSVAPPPRHVFLIVVVSHSAAEALNGPFAASLAARYGVAADYHAVAHPSVPNYLALTSGQGSVDDSYRAGSAGPVAATPMGDLLP